MSIDRLLFLEIPRWRNFFAPKHAAVVSMATMVVFLLGSLKVLTSYGEVVIMNGTEVTKCYSSSPEQKAWIAIWDIVR